MTKVNVAHFAQIPRVRRQDLHGGNAIRDVWFLTADGRDLVFVTKLSPDGRSVLYSSYLGGATGDSSGYDIAVGQDGNAYVVGVTSSPNFPIVGGFQASLAGSSSNAFVARIDTTKAGSSSLIYSTYLGGGGNSANSFGDWANGVAVDTAGLVYVVGGTTSDSSVAAFPTTSTAYQSNGQ